MGYNQLKGLLINGNRLLVGFGFEKPDLAKEFEAANNLPSQIDPTSKQVKLSDNSDIKLQPISNEGSASVTMLKLSPNSSNLIPQTTPDHNLSTFIPHKDDNPMSSKSSDISSNSETNKVTQLQLNLNSANSNVDKTNVLYVSNLHSNATVDDLKGLSKRIQDAFFEENGGLR